MIREHYLGVNALIPASPLFAKHFGSVQPKVLNGVEQPLQYPYVVLWGDPGTEGTEALSGTPDTLDLRLRVTYVAAGFEQLMWLIDQVRPALSQAIPSVPGWVPGRLFQQSLTDAQTDFDVTIPATKRNPMFAVDEFLLSSQRQ
ncbi:hypothetical protein [Arthrobacter sp. D2-10]